MIWWQGLLKDTENVSDQDRIRTLHPELWHVLFPAKFSIVLGALDTPKASPIGLIPLTIQRELGRGHSILPWEPRALVGFSQAAL